MHINGEKGQYRRYNGIYLVDEGHEVVGDAVRVLSDAAAGVRAHGVEVAQDHHVPGLVAVWELEVL